MIDLEYCAQFLSDLRDDPVIGYAENSPITVNTRSPSGDSPLKYAVTRRDHKEVEGLLEKGADPNIQGEDNCSPLHHACSRGDLQSIEMLLNAGADTHLVDIYGNKPIDYAEEPKCIERMRIQDNSSPAYRQRFLIINAFDHLDKMLVIMTTNTPA